MGKKSFLLLKLAYVPSGDTKRENVEYKKIINMSKFSVQANKHDKKCKWCLKRHPTIHVDQCSGLRACQRWYFDVSFIAPHVKKREKKHYTMFSSKTKQKEIVRLRMNHSKIATKVLKIITTKKIVYIYFQHEFWETGFYS